MKIGGCRDLQLEYIDLYLIHYPASLKPGLSGKFQFPPDPEDAFPMDFRSVWEAMEKCQKLGLTKAIGVSNFSCEKLDKILEFANIVPAVNQVGRFNLAKALFLMHQYSTQLEIGLKNISSLILS